MSNETNNFNEIEKDSKALLDKLIHLDSSFKNLLNKFLTMPLHDSTKEDIDNWKYFNEMKSRLTPGKELRIRRNNMGLSQLELAENIGVDVSTITAMEEGRLCIDTSTAEKIAKVLNCTAQELIK